jgi:hypothetical protein
MHSAYSEISQSANSYLSIADRLRLKNIVKSGFQLEDVPTVYYAVNGYQYLGEAIPNADVISFFILYI